MNRKLDPEDIAVRQMLEDGLAARVTAALSRGLADLPADIDERLRFARERALAHRLAPAALPAMALATAPGCTQLGPARAGWWPRLGMLLPLLAIVAGALLVHARQQQQAAAVAARIDSRLLVDELPPQAWADPGFMAFLKLQQP